jgi:hypothetical protein
VQLILVSQDVWDAQVRLLIVIKSIRMMVTSCSDSTQLTLADLSDSDRYEDGARGKFECRIGCALANGCHAIVKLPWYYGVVAPDQIDLDVIANDNGARVVRRHDQTPDGTVLTMLTVVK